MVVKWVIIKNLMNHGKINWYRFVCRRFMFISHTFISTIVTAEFTSIPRIVTALSSYSSHHKHHQPIKFTCIKNEVLNIPTPTHRVTTISREAILRDVGDSTLVWVDCGTLHFSVSAGLLRIIFLNFHGTQNSDKFFALDKLFCRKVSNPASYSSWIGLLFISFPRLVSFALLCLFSAWIILQY